jgi:hypothetical protein
MQRNEPLAKAGLIKFDASIVLPILEPEPNTVVTLKNV